LRHLPPTSTGIVGMVEPVFAGAVAWFALGEALTLFQLAGAALILAGVVLAETARTAAAGMVPEPSPIVPEPSPIEADRPGGPTAVTTETFAG
jgi:hypothetical protein